MRSTKRYQSNLLQIFIYLSRKFLGLYKEVTYIILESTNIASRLVKSVHKLCHLFCCVSSVLYSQGIEKKKILWFSLVTSVVVMLGNDELRSLMVYSRTKAALSGYG